MEFTYLITVSEIVGAQHHARSTTVATITNGGPPDAKINAYLDAYVWPELEAAFPDRDRATDWRVDYIKMNRL